MIVNAARRSTVVLVFLGIGVSIVLGGYGWLRCHFFQHRLPVEDKGHGRSDAGGRRHSQQEAIAVARDVIVEAEAGDRKLGGEQGCGMPDWKAAAPGAVVTSTAISFPSPAM